MSSPSFAGGHGLPGPSLESAGAGYPWRQAKRVASERAASPRLRSRRFEARSAEKGFRPTGGPEGATGSARGAPHEAWALALFRRSVLKQQKWNVIRRLLGDTQGLRCLDIGADNGVLSYLLRARGGRWTSADLDAQTVASIRSLVHTDVEQLHGGRIPFADEEFDRVVLIDGLEPLHDDRTFAQEIARVTKPGGEVIVNVPLRKNSWLRRFRLAIGQTDEAHGHVRPGYTVEELRRVLGDRYDVVSCHTYSKFFSELIDTAIACGLRQIKRKPVEGHVKGTIVTGQDLARHRKLMRLYTIFYPLIWCMAQCDRLLWFRSGYILIAKARVRPAGVPLAVAR